jgi:homopolymeric O-antigen transport system ATP-binding protein
MSDVAIKIEKVSKKYYVGRQKDASLRGSLGNLLKNTSSISEEFWALKDVSFEVKKGEVLGIIGKNGAGKSTLLKILSQITKPTNGRIELDGRVLSLLEVGTGFHPELTGRENIFLNGTILGMSRLEVKAKFDEIVDFSGVNKFLDTPVKHYSSGMYVRLAFAVAAHLEPEILIIDEVLAVGDAEFQKKCLGKMDEVAKEGRTVLFVSHNMAAIQTLCNIGVILEQGKITFNGKIEDAVVEYRNKTEKSVNVTYIGKGEFDLTKHPNKGINKSIGMIKVQSYCDGKKDNIFYGGCNFRFDIEIINEEDYENILYGFVIKNGEGEPLVGINNRHTGHSFIIKKGDKKIFRTELPKLSIYRVGVYMVDLYWGNHNTSHEIIENAFSFEVEAYDVYKTANLLDSKLNLIYNDQVILELVDYAK